MTVYDHLVLAFGQHRAGAVTRQILDQKCAAAATAGGRLFGVFTSQIGLSANHAVVLVEWPDADRATCDGSRILTGLEGVTCEQQELWEPTSRPIRGARLEAKPGIFSHRWFDCAGADCRSS